MTLSIFSCLLATCVSLEKCIFKSFAHIFFFPVCSFWRELFVFLMNCKSYLFYMKVRYLIMFCKYFLPISVLSVTQIRSPLKMIGSPLRTTDPSLGWDGFSPAWKFHDHFISMKFHAYFCKGTPCLVKAWGLKNAIRLFIVVRARKLEC